jgi:hypothetical protein
MQAHPYPRSLTKYYRDNFFMITLNRNNSRESSVAWHELWDGRPGFHSRKKQEIFLFFTETRQDMGLSSYPVGTGGSFSGVKASGA